MLDKSKKIIINYKELVINDLNEPDVNLIRSSQKILENSYSPYSGFKVGCSVLLSSGKVLSANNQENVAYPSGMCAERVALFYASSKYPNSKITLLTDKKFIFFTKNIIFVNEVLYESRSSPLRIDLWIVSLFKIISRNYDLIIDLQNSDRTSIYYFFTKMFNFNSITLCF